VIEIREAGLYCPAGDFYIDPALPVERAVITHAHSDHALPGSHAYLTASPGEALLRTRIGENTTIQTVNYGQALRLGDVTISFHPAGHILGSAQVRIERGGEVWVVSGDYKLAPDPTCEPFEPLRCHTFITESTFALPIFRWAEPRDTIAAIEDWWRENQRAGKSSLLFAYPIGKAQRILAGIDASIGPIICHGAIERVNAIYRGQGIGLPLTAEPNGRDGALVLAPPSAMGSPWTRRFAPASTAMASGWMRIRGPRRRRALDRGFVLSDHADWPGLLSAIEATDAGTIWTAHGYRGPLAHWLQESGKTAREIELPAPEADTE
jgi:putative mRNA 3-end processing factor